MMDITDRLIAALDDPGQTTLDLLHDALAEIIALRTVRDRYLDVLHQARDIVREHSVLVPDDDEQR